MNEKSAGVLGIVAPAACPFDSESHRVPALSYIPRVAAYFGLFLFGMWVFATPAAAQSATEPQVATLPAEVAELPRIGAYVQPTTLGDRLDAVINPINAVVEKTLFFDLAFGQLRSPKRDDAGELVYARDPVFTPASEAYRAVQVDDKGHVVLEGGQPVVVNVEPGGQVQTLDAAGLPRTTLGAVEMQGPRLPFLVIWLGAGAVFFTFYHGWINLRGMKHAIEIVRGQWASSDDSGDIPPYRALTSALSATVGLGNIAGVAIAMVQGGPGALFWMMFLGLFGMTSKFHESTLSQMFRVKNADGSVSGGPMYFLSQGLAEKGPGWGTLGKVLAVVFAVFLMAAALGGGNMFQSNQAFEGFFSQFIQPAIAQGEVDRVRGLASIGFGLVMAVVVGVVVIGGITRIGAATSLLVPIMAVVYVVGCMAIIALNISAVPGLIGQVFSQAFGFDAMAGGLLGVLVIGFQRAAFSSEAGIGSSAVAHAAAQTSEPVREGLVASLEPFIDTIIICFMTGMVVLITGVYLDFEGSNQGTAVTLAAFERAAVFGGWFPYILSISVVLFAFSTMIAWCYYGERAWGYLFGLKSVMVFRLLFVTCVFIGAVASLGAVIGTADLMLLSCALPNILGGIILAPRVKRRLNTYWAQYKSGELKPGEPVAPLPAQGNDPGI